MHNPHKQKMIMLFATSRHSCHKFVCNRNQAPKTAEKLVLELCAFGLLQVWRSQGANARKSAQKWLAVTDAALVFYLITVTWRTG